MVGHMPEDIRLVRTSPQTSGAVNLILGKKECCPYKLTYNHRDQCFMSGCGLMENPKHWIIQAGIILNTQATRRQRKKKASK